MLEYDFHIHGKPYSQDIWKNDTYSDYLNGMYSNVYLNASSDESYLIIEILNNTVHYTYMRSKGIRDSQGRDGSFFAMTVSLKGQYCSAAILYNLLDQIYNKIAKPSFFNQSDGYLQYKVLQLADANILDQIRSAFDKNVMHLGFKKLDNPIDTIRSIETKTISLMDVDSPEFINELSKSRIIVSCELDSAVKRCQKIESELATTNAQKKALSTSNEELKSQVSSLSQEIKSLSTKLQESVSSSEKKYNEKLTQLQKDIELISKERDSLKKKIDEATNSIELIDQPFQKLTRLLAGRFPENNKKLVEENIGTSQTSPSKDSYKIWTPGLNGILLGIIIVLCIAILYFVALKTNNNNVKTINNQPQENIDTTFVNNDYPKEEEIEFYSEEPDTFQHEVIYDKLTDCYLDISGNLHSVNNERFVIPGEKYTLSVRKRVGGNSSLAEVEDGSWSVIIAEDPINEGNVFTVPTDASTKNLLIKYETNSGEIKTRSIKVK